jgi:fatty acid desaturase
VIHDACHNAAHPNRFWNAVMGHGAALLLGFSFPVFTRVHLQHHAHVNDPKHDPDHIVSTFGPLWLIAPRFFYHEVFFFRRRLWRGNELMEWAVARMVFFAIVLLAIQHQFLPFIFNCWFAPALMVGVTLGLFFDYLPHRPFNSRNRWHNARVYPGRMMNWLIMGQNYHLVHHLWPSIPWFEYKPAYEATRHLLDANSANNTRIGETAPVYLAAVLEYICAEILELSGNTTKDHRKSTMTPIYIRQAIMEDTELRSLIINQGIVLAGTTNVKIPKKKSGKQIPPSENMLGTNW